MTAADTTVMVVGAGIMGAGIAQVAAEASHPVLLYDAREGAASQAKDKLKSGLDSLVAKGRRTADEVADTLARIKPAAALADAADASLVVEAIVEDIAAKRSLFQQLEAVVSAECVLATNTSSISVTAIANGLAHPGRLVGMHFFNPVPQMKLVEVVSGLQTDASVAARIFDLSKDWGKVPVHARSTPGFIVNRIARPFYAETLALLAERAAPPQVLDACLRGAGFRMGPCELMDLIGHDTNFAVTSSVYEANFFDKRFVPSLVQRALVDGGLLGRKSGRGFYDHGSGAGAVSPSLVAASDAPLPPGAQVVVHGRSAVADELFHALDGYRGKVSRQHVSDWVGLAVGDAVLRESDGRSASQLAAELGTDVAVFDWRLGAARDVVLAWAPAVQCAADWIEQVPLWLRCLGVVPIQVADAPGLAVARTVSMLVNEAADAVCQGVCDEQGADAAMKLGVNYPAGPFEWLAALSAPKVVGVLQALDEWYRGERYRVSPELRRRAWRNA